MGHCKLRYDENEDCPDYDDYYDFSATYVIDSEGNSTENMEKNESENDNTTTKRKAPPKVELSDNGYELIITTEEGSKIIGHRDFKQYYNQNTISYEEEDRRVRAAIKTYKQLGWRGTNSETSQALRKRFGGHYRPTEKEKKAKDIQYRKRQEFYQKVGVSANRLQKHFREQVLY